MQAPGLRRRVLAMSTDARLGPPQPEGCDVCRITGTVVFTGVSGYMLNAMRSAKDMPTRASQLVLAAAFGGLAFARWNTP